MSIFPGHYHCSLIALVIIFLSIISIPISSLEPTYNSETKDYRPSYNFSYAIFNKLPAFPADFWSKKTLFDTQQIPASRLTPEYYLQPEILPNWESWKNKIYNNHTRGIGVYGVSSYPSLFTIFNINKNETFEVSSVLSPTLGVEIYQGVRLEVIYNRSSLEMLSSNNKSYLLQPTYPVFSANWSQIITFRFKLLKNINQTIQIYERLPPEETDNLWRNQYQPLYTSGGSILGLQVPKITIEIYPNIPTEDIVIKIEKSNTSTISSYLVPLLILVIITFIGCLYVRKKIHRKTTEEKKEN